MLENGIVLVNKPTGISSNAVVNIVKRVLGAQKCGHLGTLDLEGAGLLPVTVNKATRLFDYFLNKDKTYETIFIFGIETDTLDTSGKILKEKECDIKKENIEVAIKQMIGKQSQMPPMYSAKKVGGQIAYKAARKGETLDLKPKEIEIFDFKLLEQLDKNVFKFEISCSSGTYIRSIARDLAGKMSTYGSMQCILRTRCGGFYLKDAYNLQDIKDGKFQMISCDKLFDNEKIALTNTEAEKLLNGQTLKAEKSDGVYKLFSNDTFLGLGEIANSLLKFKLRLV